MTFEFPPSSSTLNFHIHVILKSFTRKNITKHSTSLSYLCQISLSPLIFPTKIHLSCFFFLSWTWLLIFFVLCVQTFCTNPFVWHADIHCHLVVYYSSTIHVKMLCNGDEETACNMFQKTKCTGGLWRLQCKFQAMSTTLNVFWI